MLLTLIGNLGMGGGSAVVIPPVVPVPDVLGSAGFNERTTPYIGPARFRTTRDEQHPDEIRKREQAYQKAIAATEQDRLEAEAIIGPYVKTGLVQLVPEFEIDFQAMTQAEAKKLFAIEQRLQEEEAMLMILLLS